MLTRKILAAALPLALASLASLDCGGKIDPSSLPDCPTDGTCGSDCKQTLHDCAGTHQLTCTCDATGHAQCPELGAPNCVSDCNALMNGITTCGIEGETCPSPVQSGCLDSPTLYCTCSGGQFVCDDAPGCPPPAACPPPDQVVPGAPCAGYGLCQTNQAVYDCDGNALGYVECSCTGSSFGDCVAPPSPLCPVDAGSADALLTSD